MSNITANSRHTLSTPRLPSHTLLCIAAIFLGLPGIIVGIYGISRQNNPAWQNTGRAMLTCAIIGAMASALVYVVGIFVTGYIAFSTPINPPEILMPESSILVNTTSWSEAQQLPSDMSKYFADPGKKYIIAMVTVTNNGKQRQNIEPDQFELTCDNRNIYTSSDYHVSGFSSLNAALLPGGSATGYIVFNVDQNAKPVSIRYKSSF
jgi:hypothetical protein